MRRIGKWCFCIFIGVGKEDLLFFPDVIARLALCINVALGPEGRHGNVASVRVDALVDKKSTQFRRDQVGHLGDILKFCPCAQ